MINTKDWFIEYVAHTDREPTEEEWMEEVDRMVVVAELTSNFKEEINHAIE